MPAAGCPCQLPSGLPVVTASVRIFTGTGLDQPIPHSATVQGPGRAAAAISSRAPGFPGAAMRGPGAGR